ncbi:MAG: hypothetical protein DRP25_06340 [Thermotoga sp.]|nr:MAG: hypothetical protein DRP25_06340 [Thermotoga sp.]
MLIGVISEELQHLIEEVATKNNIEILLLSIQPDHVHLFISAPPRYSAN